MLYIYISIIFVIFSIILILKNPKAITTRFVIMMLVGWVMSFMGLFIYIASRNEYFYINEVFFDINLLFLQSLQRWNISTFTSVRLINLGVLLFIYSLSCFSLIFTYKGANRNKLFLLLGLLPLLQLFFYDPGIFKTYYIYILAGNTDNNTFSNFYLGMEIIHHITIWVNRLYILGSLINMFIYTVICLRKQSTVKLIRNYAIFITTAAITIAASHMVIFSWAPKILINVSVSANYYNFMPIFDLNISKRHISMLQFVVLLCFSFITIAILRYNILEYYYRQKEIHISKNITIARLGAQVFSHSVKNQMISILAEVEALEVLHSDKPQSLTHIVRIQEQCNDTLDRLNELHNRFKNITLNFEAIPLYQLIIHSLGQMSNIPPTIRVQKIYSDEMPICLLDFKHMSEVVINLVNNAVDALQQTQNAEITISIGQERKWGIISIQDNGYGMPKKILDNIFNPFFSTKSSSKNWGVGLSYCHKIVTSHRGKILVESVENKGSTFKIVLPIVNFRSDFNE